MLKVGYIYKNVLTDELLFAQGYVEDSNLKENMIRLCEVEYVGTLNSITHLDEFGEKGKDYFLVQSDSGLTSYIYIRKGVKRSLSGVLNRLEDQRMRLQDKLTNLEIQIKQLKDGIIDTEPWM